MTRNRLQLIRLRYTETILEEACRRFGFIKDTLDELEGSAFVYEGLLDGRPCILKISPGICASDEQFIGATAEQMLGEMDFVHYLADNGIPVALPVASRTGNWVESIPLDEQACFLACAFEKVPGCMYPDEAEVDFPEPVLFEWGRLLGRIHRLSGSYQPSVPDWRRLSWEYDDLLDYKSLIPVDQPVVWQRYEEMLTALHGLPRSPQVYGLIHGDLHHGNFFNDNGRLIAFDFDAAHYSWYAGDIVIALYNCLPMPRSKTARRRDFAIHYLTHLLRGYALEKPVEQAWIKRFPLLLKWNELLDYSHHHKYWDMSNLSERRRAILAEMRWRIEAEAPVVEFEDGDLQAIQPEDDLELHQPKDIMDTVQNKLDGYFRELESQGKFSGVVRITKGEEERFAGAYGYASRNWKIPNSLSVRFDTASITKLFTSVAVLQQVEAGRFDLQTSAIGYLGLEDTAIPPQVNVHHLLTHTSGIADDADEEAGEDYADLWIDKPNYSVTLARHFLPQFVNKPANFPPGQGCRYCNCGYILLGLMVEKAAQMDYRDYVRKNIFDPAGMEGSGFFHMAEVNENVAEGADPILDDGGKLTGWQKNIYSYPPIGTPDGGAHVTASDLERFLRTVKRGGLLSAELTRYFFTPQAFHSQRETWKEMYGPGLWFYVQNDGAVLFYEKDGENAGVSGMIRHYPGQDLSLVLLCNMESAAWKPAWYIHEMAVNGQFDL